jgi:hypothetical protein
MKTFKAHYEHLGSIYVYECVASTRSEAENTLEETIRESFFFKDEDVHFFYLLTEVGTEKTKKIKVSNKIAPQRKYERFYQ